MIPQVAAKRAMLSRSLAAVLSRATLPSASTSLEIGSVITAIPFIDHALAAVCSSADMVQVDDAVTANFGGRDGAGFDPAAYDILGNDVDAHELGEHEL